LRRVPDVNLPFLSKPAVIKAVPILRWSCCDIVFGSSGGASSSRGKQCSNASVAVRLSRANLRIYLSGCARIHIQPFIFSLFGDWELEGQTQN